MNRGKEKICLWIKPSRHSEHLKVPGGEHDADRGEDPLVAGAGHLCDHASHRHQQQRDQAHLCHIILHEARCEEEEAFL